MELAIKIGSLAILAIPDACIYLNGKPFFNREVGDRSTVYLPHTHQFP